MRIRARVVVVALGVAVAVAVVAGCTQRQGSTDDEFLTTTTSAGQRPSTTQGSPTASTLPDRSAEQIKASLEAAVTARNFCDLTAALDDAVPDEKDGPSIISTYEALDAAVRAAEAFRPPELADQWTIVVTGVGDGVAAAKRVNGDLADPALRAPFTAGDFEAAMSSVESWSDANCTPR